METLEQTKSRIEAAVAGAKLEIIPNDSPSAQRSFLVNREHALAVARFLRDDLELRLDYCSNVTGVDWPEAELSEKIKVKKVVDGVEKEVEEVKKTLRPAYLEVGLSPLLDGEEAWAGHHPIAYGGSGRKQSFALPYAGVAQLRISGARNF